MNASIHRWQTNCRQQLLPVICLWLTVAVCGCQKPPPRSEDPADIERNRQQHIQTMQREAGKFDDTKQGPDAEHQ